MTPQLRPERLLTVRGHVGGIDWDSALAAAAGAGGAEPRKATERIGPEMTNPLDLRHSPRAAGLAALAQEGKRVL